MDEASRIYRVAAEAYCDALKCEVAFAHHKLRSMPKRHDTGENMFRYFFRLDKMRSWAEASHSQLHPPTFGKACEDADLYCYSSPATRCINCIHMAVK